MAKKKKARKPEGLKENLRKQAHNDIEAEIDACKNLSQLKEIVKKISRSVRL